MTWITKGFEEKDQIYIQDVRAFLRELSAVLNEFANALEGSDESLTPEARVKIRELIRKRFGFLHLAEVYDPETKEFISLEELEDPVLIWKILDALFFVILDAERNYRDVMLKEEKSGA